MDGWRVGGVASRCWARWYICGTVHVGGKRRPCRLPTGEPIHGCSASDAFILCSSVLKVDVQLGQRLAQRHQGGHRWGQREQGIALQAQMLLQQAGSDGDGDVESGQAG